MKTINYQGREISVRQVNYLSGGLPITPYRDHDGDENLYKDEAGQYYLRRELNLLDCHEESERDRPASGRVHVHRISTKAAVLWACVRLNALSWDLLEDARAAMSGAAQPAPNTYGVSPATLERAARYAAKHGRSVDDMLADVLNMFAQDGEHVAKADEEVQQGEITRFAFHYAPTPDCAGVRKEIEVSAAQRVEVGRIAAAFGLEPREFLKQLVRKSLPGQPSNEADSTKLAESLSAERLSFACFDADGAKRIERVAEAREQSVQEFVAQAVADLVDCYEESFVVDPRTGELLCADHDELFTEVKHEITAAPVGQEDDASYRLHIGKRHVEFSVHLTPEQLERLEYPHMVYDEASGQEVACVLIPINPEGVPRLTVGGKEVKPDEPFPIGVFSLLDAEADAMLARYLEEAPQYTAADIISGAVSYALEMAFNDLDNQSNRVKTLRSQAEEGERFTDDGWGYVEEDVYNARQRRLGEPEHGDEEDDEAEINGAVEYMRKRLRDNPASPERQQAEPEPPKPLFSLNTPKPKMPKEK